MPQENLEAGMRRTRLPNESEEYLAKREELRKAEVEEMRSRERVAELRRQLPPGCVHWHSARRQLAQSYALPRSAE